MEMYSSYIKEIYGREVVTYDDKGFISYIFDNEVCYLSILYVKPEYRKSGVAREFCNKFISMLPKEITMVSAKIDTNSPVCNDNLTLFMRSGFKLAGTKGDYIIIYKEL